MNPMNICKMIPSRSAHQDLIPLNFVSERHYFPHTFHAFYSYSVNLVTEGYGFLHTTSGDFPIARGDLFFTFPGKQFYVENIDSMVYLYITFVGTRANALAERLHLSPSNMLFRKKEDLISLWETAIQVADASSIDLMSEAILLYTFGNICASESESGEKSSLSFILTVKRYAEEHFTDPGISLLSAAEEFGYSAKYLSGTMWTIASVTDCTATFFTADVKF